MSVTASPPTAAHGIPGAVPGPATPPALASESCPLCGAPLHPAQEWCLRCGAAARTRLAASPNWKGPIAALAIVAALSLGVIAAALVKLAGETGPAPTPITRTITAAAAPTATAPAATVPTTAVTPPATSTPTTSLPGATPAPGSTATAPRTAPPASTNKAPRKPLSPEAIKTLEKLNLSGRP